MTKRYFIPLALFAGVALFYAVTYFVDLERVSALQSRLLAADVAELDRELNQLSFVPKLLSDDLIIVNAASRTSDEDVNLANQRLQEAQLQSGLEFAFLMDEDGLTIASSNWQEIHSFVGNSYSFRPYFKGAISGNTSTFFAVGATTGIPGYFIAEPVLVNSDIIGVVVAKMALSAPVDTWRERDFESVLVDDFGVVILASDKDLLYAQTREISTSEIDRIETEQRYPLRTSKEGSSVAPLGDFRRYTRDLQSEPWEFMTLVPRVSYHLRTLFLSAIALSILSIAFLLFRNYRQQKNLVAFEQNHSRDLEEQVAKRTRDLEMAQDALISESNFAFLGKMSAAINHEINQPLASLRLNLASLRKLIEHPDYNAHEIEDIVIESDRTTKRIGLVIATLRNYSRKGNSSADEVEVNTLINDVVDVIKSERPKMSKCVVVSVDQNPSKVKGDRVLLQQALLNLLYNAIDTVINSTSPEVGVAVRGPIDGASTSSELSMSSAGVNLLDIPANGRYVILSVEDNGGGVPEDLIPLLYEPFSSSRSDQGGLGLGLTIAKQIAESHNGFLVHSNINDGSRFSLILPVI